MVRPVRHVGQQQPPFHASPHCFHVVQHLLHRHRQRILVTEYGLRQRIAYQNHLDSGIVHNSRSRVVVGGETSNGFVAEFQFSVGSNGNILTGSIRTWLALGTADWRDTHFPSSAPPAQPDRACTHPLRMLLPIVTANHRSVDVLRKPRFYLLLPCFFGGCGRFQPSQQNRVSPISYAPTASCPPNGKKYWVPLIGSLTLRNSSCKSSFRSTKSMSDVFTINRSDDV